MHVYQGNGHEGVSITNYGLVLKVDNGHATVHYNGVMDDYFQAVETGQLISGLSVIFLKKQQMTWLKKSEIWVRRHLENDEAF